MGDFAGFDLFSRPAFTGVMQAEPNISYGEGVYDDGYYNGTPTLTDIDFVPSTSNFAHLATILGTHHEHTSGTDSANSAYKIIPFSSRGVRNDVGFWIISLQAPEEVTRPATPSGLVINGILANMVSLDWADNPESNLSHYSVYRSTADFDTAARIADVKASRFTDTISSAPNDFVALQYWIRAVNTSSQMSPIHPGSTAGVSTLPRAILTTEITSNAATAQANFTNDASMSVIDTGPSTVAFLTYNAMGGDLVLYGKTTISTSLSLSKVVAAVELRVDSLGGTLLDISPGIIVSGSADATATVQTIHNPGSRTVNYYIFVKDTAPSFSGTLTASFRKLQLIDLRR